MNAFNDLNGVPATGHRYLLRDILKGAWGFGGVVVSDWASIGEMVSHGHAPTPAGRRAGAQRRHDIDMESSAYRQHLPALVTARPRGHGPGGRRGATRFAVEVRAGPVRGPLPLQRPGARAGPARPPIPPPGRARDGRTQHRAPEERHARRPSRAAAGPGAEDHRLHRPAGQGSQGPPRRLGRDPARGGLRTFHRLALGRPATAPERPAPTLLYAKGLRHRQHAPRRLCRKPWLRHRLPTW
jgi:hypothetical protein